MESLLDRLPSGSRIAVIRLRSLGDCVLTTPALALLKRYRPDLKITMIVEPRFAAIFEGNADVDEIRDDACPADLALNLHGGSRSMWMTLATRARFRAGFAHHRYSFIYSHKISRAQEILGVDRTVHTAEHLASAMFWLGVPQSEIPRAKLAAEPLPGTLRHTRSFIRSPPSPDKTCARSDSSRSRAGSAVSNRCSWPGPATIPRRSNRFECGRMSRSTG